MKRCAIFIFVIIQIINIIGPDNLKAQENYPVPVKTEKLLFYFQRSHNRNTIIYEINTLPSGQIDCDKPVNFYWIRYEEGGVRKELTYIQRKAFGLDWQIMDKSKMSFVLHFNNFKKRAIYLMKNDGNASYKAYTSINGELSELTKMYIKSENNSLGFPLSVKYIELAGISLKAGKISPKDIYPNPKAHIMKIENFYQTNKLKFFVGLASVLFLITASMLVGLKMEHWLIVSIYNICIYLNPKTRKFILAFTIFLVFGILYDFMRAYPNYLVHPVDISGLYNFEKKLFGITLNGQLLTPNEFFQQIHHVFLDALAGLFYINWMPVPLAFAFYLYFENKQKFLQFSLTFLFVNLLGFSIYYIHPAAPPWYVQLYGFNFHLGVPGNIAGLARFDELIHFPLFGSIYSRNSNVFAAMPSLHSAYPIVVFYYSLKDKVKWLKWISGIFMVGIWFSAVYSCHHYVTDVIAGITCAITGILIFVKVLLNIKAFKSWIDRYLALIS